jgi:hypothetical protein
MVQGNFIVDASVTSQLDSQHFIFNLSIWENITFPSIKSLAATNANIFMTNYSLDSQIFEYSGPLTVFSANTVTLYVCTTSSVTLMSIFLATPEHFLVNTLLLLILHSVLTLLPVSRVISTLTS